MDGTSAVQTLILMQREREAAAGRALPRDLRPARNMCELVPALPLAAVPQPGPAPGGDRD